MPQFSQRCWHALLSSWSLLMAVTAVAAELPPPEYDPPIVIRRGPQFPAGGIPGIPIVNETYLESPVRIVTETEIPALPAAAQKLLDQFNQAEQELRAKIEAELQPQRQRLIDQLQAQQDQATREARLDDAIAIRARIRQLKALQPGVIKDPGNLYTYRGKAGLKLQVYLVGSIDGTVYGTGTYTDDSDLSTAAVHAGVLKVGEADVLSITLLPGQTAYQASTRNGITSYQYQSWEGSYKFDKADIAAAPVEEVLTDSVYRAGVEGQTLSVKVRGSVTGYVWGDEVYTDDSSVGTAAVHAGLLKSGQVGTVKVMMLPGQSSYAASQKNGITSMSYLSWERSFRFIRDDKVIINPAPKTATPVTSRIHVEEDPGTLLSYRGKVDQVFYFSVVGNKDGFAYGTDTYTDDSTLGTAVVHAGLAKPGERVVVKVTIVPGMTNYMSSTRNGITSHSWGSWSSSYRMTLAGDVTRATELPK